MAAALLILLVAYFIRGITGFGSGLIAVPLLAHFLPLQFVVPLVLSLDFTASLALGGKTRKHINWSELKPLMPFGATGVILGVTLLINMPREPLLIGLGIFVLIFGVRNLLNIHVDLAGGTLRIRYDQDSGRITMGGPTAFVFEGEWQQ